MTVKKNVSEEKEKKRCKNLIGLLSANKIDNYNRGGEMGGKSKRIKRTSQKIRIDKNNKCFP